MEDGIPATLVPYMFHGVNVSYSPGKEDVIGECPFCGKNKFSINVKTSKFRCFVCDKGGNSTTFLRRYHEACLEEEQDYSDLVKDRGYLSDEPLRFFGVCKSILTGEWIIPAYNLDGKLTQLYRYVQTDQRMVMMPVKGIPNQLFGMDQFNSNHKTVFLCEGFWDMAMLWERLGMVSMFDGKVSLSSGNTLRDDANIVATPGCNTFLDGWLPAFEGKTVYILFDNDHPRKHPRTGKMLAPAGLTGVQRVARMLASSANPPEYISYLCWGADGYSQELPSGFDIRDIFTKL